MLLLTFAASICLIPVEILLRARKQVDNPYILDRGTMHYRTQRARRHPWTPGTGNVLRIAVIGDSFAAGVGGQEDDRYGSRLERMLNANEGMPPVAVHVFAKPGTSTFQQGGLFQEAMDWKADIVILGLCLNDVEDWSRPDELKTWRLAMLPPPPPSWLAPLVRRSRALQWMWIRGGRVKAGQGYVGYYRNIWDPSYSGVERFREALGNHANLCREHGVKTLAMIFPLLSHDLNVGRYPFTFAHERAKTYLEETGWPTLDLLEQFQGMDSMRLQAVPMIDPHPSEIAHRIAAETLLRTLVNRGYIAADYEPRDAYAPLLAVEGWKKLERQLESTE